MENQLSLGQEWLQQLLNIMDIAAEVKTEGFETVKADSGAVWLNIENSNFTSEQKQQLVGEKGEGIDAIQYLANTILNLDQDEATQNSFVIEIDGYRVKRNQELATLTQEAVSQVKSTGQEVEIPGLSSAERKQIHSLLEDIEGLSTESRGQGSERKLVVIPQ